VILAAGAGKRLRPLSLTRSKALAPLCGRPMIAWVARHLAEAGVRRFVVVVADLDDDVATWCRGHDFPGELRLVVQPERLGMAHALKCAASALDGRCIVHACDTVVEPAALANLMARHVAAGAVVTLALETVPRPEDVRKTAIVTRDGDRVTSIVEKPEPQDAPSMISSMPVYLCEPRLLGYLPEVRPSARGEYEIQDAIRFAIDRDRGVYGWMAEDRWQISDCDDLLALNREWLRRGHSQSTPHASCLAPVHVGESVAFGEGCLVGPEAVIESGARLGCGVTVRRALVLGSATIPDGAVIEDTVLI